MVLRENNHSVTSVAWRLFPFMQIFLRTYSYLDTRFSIYPKIREKPMQICIPQRSSYNIRVTRNLSIRKICISFFILFPKYGNADKTSSKDNEFRSIHKHYYLYEVSHMSSGFTPYIQSLHLSACSFLCRFSGTFSFSLQEKKYYNPLAESRPMYTLSCRSVTRHCRGISPPLSGDISVLARGYLRLCSQISPSMAYHAPINSDNGLLPYIFKVRVPIRQGANLTGTPIKPPSSFRPTMMPAPKLLNYGQRKLPSIRSDTSL